MITYANFSPILGGIINARLATVRELQEFYSMNDALDMYEVMTVDNYNKRVLE